MVDSSLDPDHATTYTYWLSQFAVVGLSLLWVYFRHHERFAGFRNWLSGANLVGPRRLRARSRPRRRGMFPSGASWTRSRSTRASTTTAASIALAANPYAAMPSLHSMDALIVGVVMLGVCTRLAARVALAALAGVGLVLGDGDRQPLLARRARRRRPRRSHGRSSSSAARSSGAGEPAPLRGRRQRRRSRGSASSTASSRSTPQAPAQILAASMQGVAKTR